MPTYRGFLVWGAGIILVLGPFLAFVAAGWPGDPNSCIYQTPNTCYCEAFNRAAVERGAPGVRQPVNTWFNLYSILTSFIVALMVFLDRQSGYAPNPMRSRGLIPDAYIFAVLLLGLGSMWFHASLTKWGGVFDQLSMFIYAAFLPLYTIRLLWSSEWFFWLGYPLTVVLFTVIGAIWQWELKSLVLILILVVAYLVFQVILWAKTWSVMPNRDVRVWLLWGGAVVAIIAATIFWVFSQTGKPLCNPRSSFQPHGLLWHPLAGVMAVLLYFYWRGDRAKA